MYFLKRLIILIILLSVAIIIAQLIISKKSLSKSSREFAMISEDEWQILLNKEQYYICRQGGTESAYSGLYVNHFEAGTYNCACCGGDWPLFSNDAKYDADTGWASFDNPISGSIKINKQFSAKELLINKPKKVMCARCNSHLGHVFYDGPKNTSGQRYNINSIALKFVGN